MRITEERRGVMQQGLQGRPNRGRWLAIVAALVVLALAATACGGDDDEGGNGTNTGAQGSDNAAAKAELEATLAKARKGIVKFEKPAPGSGKGLKLGFIA